MDYDTWYQAAPLEFKKKLVAGFVKQTIDYAQQHIAQRHQELAELQQELGGSDFFSSPEKIPKKMPETAKEETKEETPIAIQGAAAGTTPEAIQKAIKEKEEKYNRLLKWIGYLEFQNHTLTELSTDKLDRFF